MNHAQAIVLYQPILHQIAYNLVKCKADAEDIVQETFLKWLTIDQAAIENTKAYLIRAVTNNCLNHLNTLKRKKHEYIESLQNKDIVLWFREMNFSHLDLDINLKEAFKLMQSKLQPLERAVFVLKEAFDFDYEALQEVLDKKKDHCRQLFCRARKKLEEESSKIHLELPGKTQLLETFRKACDLGNAADLVSELKKEVTEAIRKKF
jgi:RNA polymerase sigma-70 factor (ECF subfamily)